MAVEGRGRHAQALGDLDHGDLGIEQQSLGRGQILGLEGRGPAAGVVTRTGGFVPPSQQIQRMALEILQPAVVQRPLVRRLEHDAGGLAGRKSLLPAGGA